MEFCKKQKKISKKYSVIFFFFFLIRAISAAYGSSKARDQIGATATGLCQSHVNAKSEPYLFAATLDP